MLRHDTRQLLRFGVVGGCSAGVYIVVMAGLVSRANLILAAVVAYLAAMVVNYTLQKLWTFKSDRRHREAIPKYIVTHVTAIALNSLILEFLHGRLGAPLIPTQLLAFGAIAIWSYCCQRLWVFRPQ